MSRRDEKNIWVIRDFFGGGTLVIEQKGIFEEKLLLWTELRMFI